VEAKVEKKQNLNMKMKKGNLEGKGMMKDITQLLMMTIKLSIHGLKES
jgi:hypothetical protein